MNSLLPIPRARSRAGRPSGPNGEIPSALLPARGFLPSYVEHARALTDAPPIYHLAVGLSILGAAAGNRIWTEAWGQKIRPHLWVVLIAPSSYYRKTTAMNIGLGILRQAIPAAVLPSDFSREKFIEQLGIKPDGVIPIGEFGGFLAVLGRDYMGGLKEQLTDLYDSPELWERTLKSGSVKVSAPAVSMLSGSTMDWLQKRISDGDVRGGFLPRVLFFPATDKPEWRGLVTRRNVEVERELIGTLTQLGGLQQAMAIETEAREAFDAWLRVHEEEQVDPGLQGFHSRLETAALKIAMLYQISADVPLGIMPTGLHVESMRYGIALADLLWTNIRTLTEGGFGTKTRHGADLERVEELIGHNGGILRRDLLRRTKLRLDELEPIIRTLLEGEVIEKIEQPVRGGLQVTYRRRHEGDGSGDSHGAGTPGGVWDGDNGDR
ncbi:MAG TPA: DUF3987 domain-containing protein [Candidatus Limnocylindria bacterium]